MQRIQHAPIERFSPLTLYIEPGSPSCPCSPLALFRSRSTSDRRAVSQVIFGFARHGCLVSVTGVYLIGRSIGQLGSVILAVAGRRHCLLRYPSIPSLQVPPEAPEASDAGTAGADLSSRS